VRTLTYVGVFESADVVGAVPAHQRDVAQALEAGDDKLLRGGPPPGARTENVNT
jgi:hypothetical protein